MSLLKILFYQAKQIKLSNCSSNCSNSLIHHMTLVIWCFPLYFTLAILVVEEQRTNAKSEQEIPLREQLAWEKCWLLLSAHLKISGHMFDQCRWLQSRLIAAQSCLISDKETVDVIVQLCLSIQIFNFNYLFQRRVEYLLPEGSIHFKWMWTAFKFRELAKSFVDDKSKLFYMRWACATPGCPVSFGSFPPLAENGNTSH